MVIISYVLIVRLAQSVWDRCICGCHVACRSIVDTFCGGTGGLLCAYWQAAVNTDGKFRCPASKIKISFEREACPHPLRDLLRPCRSALRESNVDHRLQSQTPHVFSATALEGPTNGMQASYFHEARIVSSHSICHNSSYIRNAPKGKWRSRYRVKETMSGSHSSRLLLPIEELQASCMKFDPRSAKSDNVKEA